MSKHKSRSSPLKVSKSKKTTVIKDTKVESKIDTEIETKTDVDTDGIIWRAKKQLGVRYRLGGTDPKTGFDCSGFTKYVYSSVNINLGANASSQATQGKAIKYDDATKGDLIFFNGGKAGGSKVGHVGIITETSKGDIKFIHASTSKGIMISALSEKYFKDRFVKIRRVK